MLSCDCRRVGIQGFFTQMVLNYSSIAIVIHQIKVHYNNVLIKFFLADNDHVFEIAFIPNLKPGVFAEYCKWGPTCLLL